MAGAKALALLLLLALTCSALSATSLAGGDHHMQLHGLLSSSTRGECRGTVGECGADADTDGDDDAEGELGSASAESHRRFLQGRGYISYGALRRNQVPCSRRGASYYNCRPGGQANPYRRGCSRITRCRG
ncbi:rapid alkalinization factor-like [Lolium rigidum]|uniref:rapid alkalinization factor-like n=1 Tax=Lolium rigidum TaxID=89674 RepID=UPI001F5D49F9|nr:rapid alkalinization factor-like [Lolium rigidum]